MPTGTKTRPRTTGRSKHGSVKERAQKLMSTKDIVVEISPDEKKFVDPYKLVERRTEDWPIDTIVQRIASNHIVFPEYQRNYLLTGSKEQLASRIIESILSDIGVPSVYLFQTSDGKFIVVDGLQRLRTIVRFVMSEFPFEGRPRYFKNFRNKKFNDLPENAQRMFLGRTVPVVIINTSSSRLEFTIFEDLNKGSTVLNPHEIRRALWGGQLDKEINRISNRADYKPYFLKKVNNRFEIDEAILRFFACVDNYRREGSVRKPSDGGISRMLNDFMIKYQAEKNWPEIAYWTGLFNETFDMIIQVFGINAFSLNHLLPAQSTGRERKAFFNTWVMTAQMVAFSDFVDRKAEVIKRKVEVKHAVEQVLASDEFRLTLHQARTNTSKLQLRNNRIHDAISRVLNGK
jgi:hypothetical protein